MTKYALSVSSKDCKWLGDFYFDARYPGDNFVVVSREDALECFSIVEAIQTNTDRILEEAQKEREREKSVLAKMRFFE